MLKTNKNLKISRVKAGMSQKEFAKLIDMPVSTYRKKEYNVKSFTLDECEKIRGILNIDPMKIFL